jgi:hypothetical protein
MAHLVTKSWTQVQQIGQWIKENWGFLFLMAPVLSWSLQKLFMIATSLICLAGGAAGTTVTVTAPPPKVVIS